MLLIRIAGIASAADPDSRVDVLTKRVELLEVRVAQLEEGVVAQASSPASPSWATARFTGVMVESGSLYRLDEVGPVLSGDLLVNLRSCLIEEGVPYEPFHGTFYVTSSGTAPLVSVNTPGLNMGDDEARALFACADDVISARFRLPEKPTRAPTSTHVSFIFSST